MAAQMRFALFGTRDCPDWLLGAVPTLSRLSCIRVALLALYILREAQVAAATATAAARAMRAEMRGKMVLLLDRKVEGEAEFELVIAALRYLLLSAVQFNVAGAQFEDECMQLGLPRDTSAALRRRLAHAVDKEAIGSTFRENCLKVSPATLRRWTVEATVGTDDGVGSTKNAVNAVLHFGSRAHGGGGRNEDIIAHADADMVDMLLFELKRARDALASS